ncbi:four-carbon acid sugar kinase family protein [Anaerocolumna sp. MB42-C2]|uniref:four-carbon acid sugar kinase family protein n=1 Tax=Anaerocolumna sp. MB42-C2 TaxID=3070997 RepID=UPI0027DF8B13|nr:four-carbon acid sugar kinase family protein [Anaerocolumna sp. MB42-C2]WMJ88795.1 four-carbon acid sugar kinase family protein [Anaerocolumna sp. MB42-C2]
MPQCVIIADDLTGANATGVLLKKISYNTYTVMNTERLELSKLAESDCIVYPTDSRAVEPSIAYNRVYNVANLLKNEDVLIYSKRIDSTLRGNLGYETDALLDALNNDAIAIVVPCFPQANRILVGGYMLVNMVPLHKTEAALDPKTPVHTSLASDIFAKQSIYPIASLYIKDIMLGKKHLAAEIKRMKEEGNRIIIFDCISQEDLEIIADGVIESGVKFIAVDPGSFTATITRKLIDPREKKNKYKILATVGSVNAVAKNQLNELLLAQKVLPVYIDTKELVLGEKRRVREINRVVEEIQKNCGEYDVCAVIGNGILPENRLNFNEYAEKLKCLPEEVSNLINDSLAEITYLLLNNNPEFRGLYTSGGDITVAVSRKFKTAGIRLLDEVVPLAAYGEFISGEFDGLKIVTKGGMAGDQNAMNLCIRYLKEKLYI